MKINTFKQYKFTADLWTFTTTHDAQGGPVLTYAFNRNITVRAVTSVANRLFVYFKDTEFDAIDQCQLQNFKDASGQEVRTGGIWTLDKCEPNMTLWGMREGFKGVATYLGQAS